MVLVLTFSKPLSKCVRTDKQQCLEVNPIFKVNSYCKCNLKRCNDDTK